MKLKNKYIVYKHTSPSGKVYIGITMQSTKERWRSGKGYKQHYIFKLGGKINYLKFFK